jgi:hypothetical protein
MRHQPADTSQRLPASTQVWQENAHGLPDPTQDPPEQDDAVVHQAPSSHHVPAGSFS